MSTRTPQKALSIGSKRKQAELGCLVLAGPPSLLEGTNSVLHRLAAAAWVPGPGVGTGPCMPPGQSIQGAYLGPVSPGLRSCAFPFEPILAH